MKNLILTLGVLAVCAGVHTASATEVSGIFRDHMVVQRDKPLPVWGRGIPGERVRVSFRGNVAETAADGAGRWQVVLPASEVSREGLELVVEGQDRLVFSDVLVGDVWLVSGQSNAEMTLGSASGAVEEADWCAANAPLIRTTKFAHESSFGPDDYKTVNGPWYAATKRDVRRMTALGYFFAKEIVTRTGIPIGILDNNRSGCRIEPYLAPEGYAMTPGLADEKIVTHGWPWYYTQYYNMIQPIVRFPIAGALWYQGCANSSDPGTAYYDKLLALARGWRTKWGYDFPFYIVSLASWDRVDTNPAGGTGFGPIRDLQRRAAMDLPHAGLVVTTDIGDAKDIHPKNKREAGHRAALWARRDVYGEKDLVVSGPLFEKAVAEGGAMRVSFTSCGGGLVAEGNELKGFAIAGADKVWHWAEARIDGTSVIVLSPSVPAPVAVRYAFHGNVLGRATLRNAEGLPASPFRSDDWPTGSVFVRSPSFADFDLRAKAGENLTVVYFGGSLTWSANASEPNRTGFRGQMSAYFRRKYPKAHFTFIDAAIGGTGSKLGVFRLERDVMAHHPDLVFIDFICNDGGECRDIANSCCYEYLLRSIIGRGVPVMQMFFTFRFWAEHGAPYDAPDCHPRLTDYRRLVDAYATGVGDVYTDALIPALDDGSIDPDRTEAIRKVWPIDAAHPGDFGYALFAKAGQIGYERAVEAKRTCRVPATPVLGTVRDVVRTDPATGDLPAGWHRTLTYRTSAWYDGLSSRWMDDVAVFTGSAAMPLSYVRTGNLFAVLGEGDGDALGWDLAVDGTKISHHEMKFPVGRLMVFRTKQLEGWEKGFSSEHAFTLTPVVRPAAGKGKAELRVGSICTATLVPDAKMYAETKAADEAADEALRAKRAAANLEKLDHGRGKAK